MVASHPAEDERLRMSVLADVVLCLIVHSGASHVQHRPGAMCQGSQTNHRRDGERGRCATSDAYAG